MWGRRADHWAAAREPRLLAVRAVLKEVTASSGSGERQSRGQARGQSASVAGGRAHTAHAAEGRSVSYGRSGSAQRGPPPRHTSNCHPRPRHLDARSRCRAIKRERNGKETQEVNPTESRPLCKRSQSSLCRPPAVRTTTKETETVRGCSPVTGNESSLPHTSGFRTCSSPAQGDLGDSPAVPIEERYENKDVISQLSRWENDAPSRRRSRRVPCASSCSNL